PGRLDRVAGPGWLAVGDAASAIDPLSGAGIAKSLLGAIAAARAADRGLAGSIAPLAAYAETIRSDFEGARRMGAAYYGRERRWPASPFWRRRHGPAPAYDSGRAHGRPGATRRKQAPAEPETVTDRDHGRRPASPEPARIQRGPRGQYLRSQDHGRGEALPGVLQGTRGRRRPAHHRFGADRRHRRPAHPAGAPAV